MLNKENLRIHEIASNDVSRVVISGVALEKNRTIATDGRMLIVVPLGNDIPEIKNTLIIPKKSAELIMEFLEKGYYVDAIDTAVEGKLKVKLNRQDTPDDIHITVSLISNQNYPNIDKAVAKSKVKVTLVVNPELMMKLMRQYCNYSGSNEGVVIKIHEDPDEAIEFEARNMKAMLMPIRIR